MKTVMPGIREKSNGRFFATKSIEGKRYYKEFDSRKEAIKWKNEFHPLLSPVVSKNSFTLAASDQSNGKNKAISFKEVLEKYKVGFLKSLEASTQYKKLQRLSKFAANIENVPMCRMSPEVITSHLDLMLELARRNPSKRCNFDKELKDLSSIFNWYRVSHDNTFYNPVMPVHFKIGKIRDIPYKQKDMDMDEFAEFVAHLRPMYQSMAILMLLWALRVGEAAAIMEESVNFKKKEAWILNVIVWIKGRPQLKRGTKTGADAKMKLTDIATEELRKLEANKPKSCKYYFHNKGNPLRYGLILNEFNRALKSADLPYSGTHIIRHTMATITRRNAGLDAAQAILRHTTARMSEGYARLDASEKVSNVVILAEKQFRKASGRASECVHESASS